MKRTIVFILAFSFATSSLLSQVLYARKGDVLSVFAVSGLNLRTGPDKKAKVVSKIAYAEKVKVVEPSNAYEIIEDRPGYWLKVLYNKQEGFLFSGYLTKLQPPQIKADQITCFGFDDFPNWVKKNLKNDTLVNSGKRLFKGYDLDGKDWGGVEWEFYSSGTWVYHYSGYEWQNYIVESFDINFNDVLNFFNYYTVVLDSKCQTEPYYKKTSLTLDIDENGYFSKITCDNPRPFSATKVAQKVIIEIGLWDL